MKLRTFCVLTLCAGMAVSTTACKHHAKGKTGSGSQASSEPVSLNGAGSTFAAILYQKWAAQLNHQANIQINYQAIGSGGGIKAISHQTVAFGGTDAFYNKNPKIIDLPTAAGAVVLTYNLPKTKCNLKLTGATLANIYLGKITKWNDPAIAKTNGSCKLPASSILVVHRSDGSGTTNIFTSYLSKVSPAWKKKVGAGISVAWPTDANGGLAGKGNPGVAQTITQNPNAIGYVELAYAMQNHLPMVQLQNPTGKFVAPTLKSTQAALGGLKVIPADRNISPVTLNVNAPGAYPIVGSTYVMVYKDLSNVHDAHKAQALVDVLCWGVNSNGKNMGQDYANALDYAALPANVRTADINAIKSMTFKGKPVHSKYCK